MRGRESGKHRSSLLPPFLRSSLPSFHSPIPPTSCPTSACVWKWGRARSERPSPRLRVPTSLNPPHPLYMSHVMCASLGKQPRENSKNDLEMGTSTIHKRLGGLHTYCVVRVPVENSYLSLTHASREKRGDRRVFSDRKPSYV